MSFVCCIRGQYSWDDEIKVDGHVAHMEGWELDTGLCWETREERGHLYDLTVVVMLYDNGLNETAVEEWIERTSLWQSPGTGHSEQ